MATFYILFSKSIDRYYIGNCLDLEKRISEHNVLRVCAVADKDHLPVYLAQTLIEAQSFDLLLQPLLPHTRC